MFCGHVKEEALFDWIRPGAYIGQLLASDPMELMITKQTLLRLVDCVYLICKKKIRDRYCVRLVMHVLALFPCSRSSIDDYYYYYHY